MSGENDCRDLILDTALVSKQTDAFPFALPNFPQVPSFFLFLSPVLPLIHLVPVVKAEMCANLSIILSNMRLCPVLPTKSTNKKK